MESSVSWLRGARVLAERYDVIMPDARVHGRSAGGETGFTPEILVEDVAGLIRTLNLERPMLIGRSNGAVTAFLVAARYPYEAVHKIYRPK
jgi:pimeloyl-ACP methyl ester carboxylesterase